MVTSDKRLYYILAVGSKDESEISWRDITSEEIFDSKCFFVDEIDYGGYFRAPDIDKQFGEDANEIKGLFIDKSVGYFRTENDCRSTFSNYAHTKESIKKIKASKYYESNESLKRIVELILNNGNYEDFVIFFYN